MMHSMRLLARGLCSSLNALGPVKSLRKRPQKKDMTYRSYLPKWGESLLCDSARPLLPSIGSRYLSCPANGPKQNGGVTMFGLYFYFTHNTMDVTIL